MNKTVIFVVFSALIALTLVETLLVLFVVPDHFASFSGFMLVLLGIASGFAATVWGMKQQKDEIQVVKEETSAKLDVVQRQTNGTLTKLTDALEEKNEVIRAKDRLIMDLENALLYAPKKGKVDE